MIEHWPHFLGLFAVCIFILWASLGAWLDGGRSKMDKDWIEWAGGDCPVPDNTPVAARMRGGRGFITVCPQEFHRWDHQGNEGDIVAYRIIINPFLH